MNYGLWLSAAGLQANRYQQDVIANNLANLDTTGFKRDLAVFSERAVASREPFGDPTQSQRLLDSMTGGTFVAPTCTVFSQGTVQPTGRPLDVSLEGDGFFAVRDGDRTVYTRDGQFAVDAKGNLVTSAGGRPVLSDRGTPIRIPADQARSARIGQDGTIRAGDAVVAKLGIVDFADRRELRKEGSNVYSAADTARKKPAKASLISGAKETSTVEPMAALVSMMEASRAYELNANMISLQDTMLSRAVNDVGKVA